ncbi:class I SAM-dependent methyltransferase [Halomonas organivorans]
MPRVEESASVGEDWRCPRPRADYDKTLMAWLENFDALWHEIAERYNERTRRMFRLTIRPVRLRRHLQGHLTPHTSPLRSLLLAPQHG